MIWLLLIPVGWLISGLVAYRMLLDLINREPGYPEYRDSQKEDAPFIILWGPVGIYEVLRARRYGRPRTLFP